MAYILSVTTDEVNYSNTVHYGPYNTFDDAKKAGEEMPKKAKTTTCCIKELKSPEELYRVKVTCKLEISDHDGYCSDNENEYTEKVITKLLLNAELSTIEREFTPNLNEDGSNYCNINKKAVEAGLGRHDWRITVMNVEHNV